MSEQKASLTKYAWLSVGAAVTTIALKTIAWRITGSVGLLSDAAESLVNLAAAILALAMLRIAARPPDSDHHFGHDKAEYFSAAVEGILIFVAAAFIIVSAVERLIHPQPLQSLSVGIIISAIAAVINGAVGIILIRVGTKHRSPTLVADGRHLWTDVITTGGVIVAIALVWITKWEVLDPIVAILVGVNIIITGIRLIHESTRGLMDITLPDEENETIARILAGYSDTDVDFHGLRTRLSGRQRFAILDVLVPGEWTVRRSHDLIEEIEQKIKESFPEIEIQIHLEPKEDPRAYCDFNVEVPIPKDPKKPKE